jgi:hypothetical protein
MPYGAQMSLARYFVFQRHQAWVVALEGTLVARCNSRAEAVSRAIVMADLMGSMHHDADVMVEADGRLELVWTYGVDSLPSSTAEAA